MKQKIDRENHLHIIEVNIQTNITLVFMKQFYEQLDKHIESLNKRFLEKFCIKQTLYDNIVLVLRDGWGDAQLKFWVLKNFKLVTIGDQNVVYEKGSNLPVITYANLYEKINECHMRVGHHGRDKTWVEVGVQRLMT